MQFLLKCLRVFPGARRTASNRRFEPMRPAKGGIDLPMANQPQTVMKRFLLWSSPLRCTPDAKIAPRGGKAATAELSWRGTTPPDHPVEFLHFCNSSILIRRNFALWRKISISPLFLRTVAAFWRRSPQALCARPCGDTP